MKYNSLNALARYANKLLKHKQLSVQWETLKQSTYPVVYVVAAQWCVISLIIENESGLKKFIIAIVRSVSFSFFLNKNS